MLLAKEIEAPVKPDGNYISKRLQQEEIRESEQHAEVASGEHKWSDFTYVDNSASAAAAAEQE